MLFDCQKMFKHNILEMFGGALTPLAPYVATALVRLYQN
jgi:hypothetical protein